MTTLVVRRLAPEAIDLIRAFEGFSAEVYRDSAGLATIGIGHLIRRGEAFDGPITEDRAEDLLRRDLAWARRAVQRLTRVDLDDGEFGALTSLVFNIGSGAFQRSTLRMKLNRGERRAAADEFPKWRRAGGRVIPGLVRRRAAERQLFLSGLESPR